MFDFVKNNGMPIIIGIVILLGVVFLSEAAFGDLTEVDSYKPLWFAGTAIVLVAVYLIYNFFKSSK